MTDYPEHRAASPHAYSYETDSMAAPATRRDRADRVADRNMMENAG